MLNLIHYFESLNLLLPFSYENINFIVGAKESLRGEEDESSSCHKKKSKNYVGLSNLYHHCGMVFLTFGQV
jgi:hypothetical protein